jgi:beta-glucosidase
VKFPKGFKFGVASSAAQTEGCGFDGGRGKSIWDAYAEKPGVIRGGFKPSTAACDSYRLFDTDLKNLIALGVNSYRMSIAWPRVLPEGVGKLNQAGVDYYRCCFEKLLEAGITPNVTLYHWDLPQALEEKGGWLSRDSKRWFQEYADKMFRLYGDIVPDWVTVNEPISVYCGYGLGFFAPGYANRAWGNQARHNVMTASGAAVEAFRASGFKGKIGAVVDIWKRVPMTDAPEDIALARDEDEENWKFYTDRLLGGGYSEYILDKFAREGTLMQMEDEDFRLTKLPLDFYGMNYYNIVPVSTKKEVLDGANQGGNFAEDRKVSNPEKLYDVLNMIRDMYQLKIPVYISENGYGHEGEEVLDPKDGMIHDDYRIEYLSQALDAVERLIAEGVDIRGYYLWTLMDNWEWSAGHDFKYGLLHTNFETYERTWKKSAYWYRDFIAQAKK